ncbi:AraC family transcriptional regulator, partial [Aminomonas paucivorans]|uniref:AraC family transcriptional regulator n=1 Tax=Aminomonas paucivorans TaxID=81412 RepID=UPI003323A3FE
MPDPNPAFPPRPTGGETRPPQEELARLARLILPLAPYDGSFELRLPGVQVSRVSRPYKELAHGIHRAALCMVAQGSKRVLLEKEALVYDASTLLVSSVDLPVAAQVTQASPEAPFLSLRLDLDPRRISDLLLKVHPHGLPKSAPDRAMYVAPAERPVLRAAAR